MATLVYLALAWLAGIAAAKKFTPGITWWLVLVPLSLVGLILAPRRRQPLEPRSPWPMIFGCGLLFALGAVRLSTAIPLWDESDLASYNDQGLVTIEGLIVDMPDVRDTHVNLRVRAEAITTDDGKRREVTGLVLVQAPRVGNYRYGDPVTVQGELHTPPEFEGFSYRDYLARQDVYSIVQYALVTVTGERCGNPVRAAMLDFRELANRTIVRLLPDPQASLLSGILLGIESGISPEVRDDFNAVGATHVIAISGSNLVILAGLIQNLTRRFVKEKWAAIITVVGVVAYAIFVGGNSAVIRAAIMTSLSLVAARLGRQTYGLTSLAFAVILMTVINPFTLWDVSFQLSALATLGLILYVEPLQRFFEKGLSAKFSTELVRQIMAVISDALIVTVAAQIATTPIMAFYFERLPLLSLLANFLIIPAQTPLIVLGGLGVIAALIIWPVGQVLAWGSWLFLSWTVWVVRLFAKSPFASLAVEDLSLSVVGGIYLAMFGLTLFMLQSDIERTRQLRRLGQVFGVKAVGSAGIIIAVLLFVGAASLPDGRLHVTFIDVEGSAATLIETPSGRHILVDTGSSGRKLSTALGSELPFWERRLDLVILTQPTPTHIGGLPSILERYHIDAVMTNGVKGDTDLADVIWEKLDKQETLQVVASPGMQVRVGDGVTLTVLYTQANRPRDETEPGELIVLLLTYGDARILLTGDLTEDAEQALLQKDWLLEVTVLQIPRSGHRAVSSEDFLTATNPQVGVLSVDAGNRYGLPHTETLERLEALDMVLYRTDQVGSVHVSTDGYQLWVRTNH